MCDVQHRRIARQRSDWLHKLTTGLAGAHQVIAIEDLRVAAMTASARGSADRPGSNVKAGLNRAILDQGWGEFRRQLEYKLAAVGGQVIAVPPAYTSCTCRVCGHVSADNRRTQSVFACVACGHAEHADVHAARNILTVAQHPLWGAGHAVWLAQQACPAAQATAHGGDVRRRGLRKQAAGAAPAKWEPAEAAVAGFAPATAAVGIPSL